MPTYQYACTGCGDRLEVVQRFSDDSLTVCVDCGGKLRKVFSPVGIVFKGSGFYRTDSRSGSVSSGSASGDGSADGSGSASGNGKSGADRASGSDGGSASKSESGATSSSDSSGSAGASGAGGSAGTTGTGSKVA